QSHRRCSPRSHRWFRPLLCAVRLAMAQLATQPSARSPHGSSRHRGSALRPPRQGKADVIQHSVLVSRRFQRPDKVADRPPRDDAFGAPHDAGMLPIETPPLRVERLIVGAIERDYGTSLLEGEGTLILIADRLAGAPDLMHGHDIEAQPPCSGGDSRRQVLFKEESWRHDAWFKAMRDSISSGKRSK